MEQTTQTIRLTFRVVVTHYTKVTCPWFQGGIF